MSGHPRARPVGGPILDRTVWASLALFAVAAAVIAYRLVAGLGAVSNMNDGYTWGIWEPVNVVVFTGLGAGAYAVGLLCYVLNAGRYHPLVRPAVLLGAIAYSLGGASVVVALGRYWNVWRLAWPGLWNLGSVLLEVAICVLTYVCVLWIEMLPSALERLAQSPSAAWAARGRRWGARLTAAMPFVIALALLLPTMHQSSLGGLMLIAGPKLHPLWHTAFLPLLALVSCLSMGCGAVVVLSGLLRSAWNARHDPRVLSGLSRVNGGLLLAFAALRLGDLAAHGKLRLLAAPDRHLAFFAAEMALFVVPGALLLAPGLAGRPRRLGALALASVAAGTLWRVDTFITCYLPGERYTYFPAFGEIAVTVGMAAIGVAVFVAVARRLPVLELEEGPAAVAPATAAARTGLRLATAPLLGGLYVVALPFVLLGAGAAALARKVAQGLRSAASGIAAALTPPWSPGAVHLSGDEGDGADGAPAGADPELDAVAREIDARRGKAAGQR